MKLQKKSYITVCVLFISAILCVVICIIALWMISFTISLRYDVPTSHAFKEIKRFVQYSMIKGMTTIYDPADVTTAVTGPDIKKYNLNYQRYVRIEKYFAKPELKEVFHEININNEKIVRSNYYFSYQTYDEPRLHELRRKYFLDDVVSTAENEFEEMVLLRNWTRSQFRRSDYQLRRKNFDALKILDSNLRNNSNEPYNPAKHEDPCKFYPLLYSQVAVCMGFQARIVMRNESSYIGHGMVEVWSNLYKKWILMDAELNYYYEKDGIPLNLLEIHNERYGNKPSSVKIIYGKQNSGDISTTLVFLGVEKLDINKMIQLHSYFGIVDFRNDWMTNHYFRGHPVSGGINSVLYWEDNNLPPLFTIYKKTDNINDFYWTLNQTEILVKRSCDSKKLLDLAFKTYTPNFDYFEITIDDSKIIETKTSLYEWDLHPGLNSLNVRSINQFGIKGIPSAVKINMIK